MAPQSVRRKASSPRLAGPLALTGWYQSVMGAFNALSSNLPLAAAKLLDELGLGPKRVEGASKELHDEKATRGVGPRKDGRYCGITTPHVAITSKRVS